MSWVRHILFGYGLPIGNPNGRVTVRFLNGVGIRQVPPDYLLLLPLDEVSRLVQARVLPGGCSSGFPSAYLRRNRFSPPREVAPSVGRRRTQVYREDWNADTSDSAAVHDAVAGERRTDLESLSFTTLDCLELSDRAYLRKRARANLAAPDLEAFERANLAALKRLNAGDRFVAPLAEGEVTPVAAEPDAPVAPATPRREFLQRLSQRQRRLLRAFKLWRSGLSWDQVATEMGESRATVRAWRQEVVNLLGTAVLWRERTQARQNGRFAPAGDDVGCERNGQKQRKPA